MKILVTGIAGFLGSHLADALQKEGHSIIGVDNLIGGDIENVPLGVRFYQYNTEDETSMKRIFAENKIDIVYHCACTAYEGLSVFSPSFCCRNTFQNTVSLLSVAIQSGIKRFIYCSSMSRYGKIQSPFRESDEPRPEDPYAVSKLASEQIIKQLCETHGVEYAIAIPHNIIGTRQKYDDPFRNVVSIFINRMLQGKPPIIYGDGEQKRNFSPIEDCIFSLIRMIDCKSGEIFNIGTDTNKNTLTINQIADILKGITNYKGENLYLPARPREVFEAHCSSDKIREWFGYTEQKPIIECLSEMVEDIKRRGAKEFIYHIPLEIRNEKTPKTWTQEIKM